MLEQVRQPGDAQGKAIRSGTEDDATQRRMGEGENGLAHALDRLQLGLEAREQDAVESFAEIGRQACSPARASMRAIMSFRLTPTKWLMISSRV